ncbi:heavy metal translocatin [Boletus edulis]|nr:heavy metal translocatin [Boletus edulis]
MDITLFLSNLHCTSCARDVEQSLAALDPAPLSVVVSVASSSVSLRHLPALPLSRIKAALEDAGFDLLTDPPTSTPRVQQCAHHSVPLAPSTPTPHSITLSVSGMSCASCVNTITDMLSPLPGVSDLVVSLLTNSATLRIDNIALISSVTDTLDDCGFEAEVVSTEPILPSSSSSHPGTRTLSLRVDGMYCRRCPSKVVDVLRVLDPNIIITKPFVDHTHPIIEISYQPAPPDFTIRSIIACIQSADPAFKVSPHHLPTLEQRTRSMQLHERTLLLSRLSFTFLAAVPTFILSVVYANLAPPGNPSKAYLMQPMWNGNASRTQWSLFFLATPVMFYSASLFHYRSIREILAMWRKGSTTPIIARFTRFGSMNLLVSIGVSAAYFASVVLLALAASQPPASNGVGDSTTYFDAVVLLTLFLLSGRYLEAYSKARTADAITALASLRPAEALLLTPRDPSSDVVSYSSNADLEKGDPEKDDLAIVPGHQIEKVYVDLLEVGDIVRVLNGATPPSDGTLVPGATTSFDESSLTGEAKLITKKPGDRVFLGTINKEKPVDVRLDAVGGVTMLDHIVRIVREGRVRRAPIERIADMVTSIFVPVITLLAIITWVVWLALGLGGGIPRDYLDADAGGWTVWSLEFAISVFVVACPCGIALAAPTALLVGSGLAAQYGILARGGGEAFQEMAHVDTVVFDKTGTLTSGGQPQVSNFEVTSGSTWTFQSILGIAAELESASSHPLGTAVKQYATKHGAAHLSATGFDEVPGRGVKAYFGTLGRTALIGNEEWMREHGAILDNETTSRLAEWTTEAKSVVLVAISDGDTFSVVATFAVTDPLRPEAPDVIRLLREKGIETWMISGDHEQTAKAVAKMVGIPETNVLAGVLPHQKAEKIEWLQANGVKRRGSRWQRVSGKKTNKRFIVAMVGDGINDAPALAASDIGIAIGSGSDVAISSASFILVSSNLKSLLTLSDLSRKVFNRVKQNFAWAFMYNIVAIPVAAGVIYPVGHARLSPVWAALAMAFSSVSVVVSSLLLRLYEEPKV